MIRLTFFIVLACMEVSNHVALGGSIGISDESTIKAIFSMFRHGDRSPISFWPNDPHKNYSWPGGEGALSEKGVHQHYNLGMNLRQRYGHLLPEDGRYSSNNMLVKSSFIERCVMSGLSLLTGFMPPRNESYPVPFKWQPVPIVTIPQYEDNILSLHRPCKKYDELLNYLLKYPPADIKTLSEDNRDMFKLLEDTGRVNITYTDIGEIYDTLIIYRDNNLTLPAWAKDIFPERMRPFAERAYSVYTETPYMKKVKGGAWITEVYNRMVAKKARSLNPDRKIFFYASHDSTIIGILNALGVLPQAALLPEYAAMMVFELHSNEELDNDFEVKLVYYKNSDVTEPKELSLPNCLSPCSLTKFGEAVKDLIILDYDQLCEKV